MFFIGAPYLLYMEWCEKRKNWDDEWSQRELLFYFYFLHATLFLFRCGGETAGLAQCLSVVTRSLCSCQLSRSAVVASFSTGVTGNLISLSVCLTLCLPPEPPLTSRTSSCRQSVTSPPSCEERLRKWTSVELPYMTVLFFARLCTNKSSSAALTHNPNCTCFIMPIKAIYHEGLCIKCDVTRV